MAHKKCIELIPFTEQIRWQLRRRSSKGPNRKWSSESHNYTEIYDQPRFVKFEIVRRNGVILFFSRTERSINLDLDAYRYKRPMGKLIPRNILEHFVSEEGNRSQVVFHHLWSKNISLIIPRLSTNEIFQSHFVSFCPRELFLSEYRKYPHS